MRYIPTGMANSLYVSFKDPGEMLRHVPSTNIPCQVSPESVRKAEEITDQSLQYLRFHDHLIQPRNREKPFDVNETIDENGIINTSFHESKTSGYNNNSLRIDQLKSAQAIAHLQALGKDFGHKQAGSREIIYQNKQKSKDIVKTERNNSSGVHSLRDSSNEWEPWHFSNKVKHLNRKYRSTRNKPHVEILLSSNKRPSVTYVSHKSL